MSLNVNAMKTQLQSRMNAVDDNTSEADLAMMNVVATFLKGAGVSIDRTAFDLVVENKLLSVAAGTGLSDIAKLSAAVEKDFVNLINETRIAYDPAKKVDGSFIENFSSNVSANVDIAEITGSMVIDSLSITAQGGFQAPQQYSSGSSGTAYVEVWLGSTKIAEFSGSLNHVTSSRQWSLSEIFVGSEDFFVNDLKVVGRIQGNGSSQVISVSVNGYML